jgi:hypothetical protein
VLGLAFLCGLIYSLQLLKKDWFWFLRVAGTLALIILLIYSSLFSVFLIEWCLDTEYIVERNGQKMIAEEQYWLDPAVDYYEYKNCIVRGKYIEFSSVPTIKDEKNIIVK